MIAASPRAARSARHTAGHGFAAEPAAPRRCAARRVGGGGRERRESATALLLVGHLVDEGDGVRG
eukprot:scaffold25609_cov66-Phaeocystis_antarctica.AAC.1